MTTADTPSPEPLPEARPTGTRAVLVALAHLAGQSWTWLKWPVALGILAWMYHSNQENVRKIAATPKAWGFAIVALLLITGSTLITFVRWYFLVRAQEFPFRLRDAVRYGFIGVVSNYISVGSVGGDLFKAVLLARDQTSRKAVAVATVLLDRVLGLLALFMVGAAATRLPNDIPHSPELELATALLWIGTLGGLAGLALMLFPATTRWGWVNRLPNLRFVGKILGELLHGVKLYQSKPKVVLAAMGLSLVGHAGLISGFYFCALWMRQPWIPGLVSHFYFMPNAELFGVLIPTPGGVGALEGAIGWFYVQLRPEMIPHTQAEGAGIMAGIAFRVVTLAIAAVGGGYYLTARREITAALDEAAHPERS
ncbi:MAG: lysylphosphatidylglycerol synthase transmembrane domain-containing protein [Deltaproteobacteria bacterium]